MERRKMAYLGSLEGLGILASDERRANVHYRIAVFQRGLSGVKFASGTISTDDPLSVMAGEAHLTLKDGTTIDVVVDSFTVPAGKGEITVSGPVPGF